MELTGLLVALIVSHSLVFVNTDVRPHVVTIIADDLGWNDVGFHGSNQIPTPNIDALAYNGVILNRHYTLPTCTPSRTAYLTGRYPIRTGMQGYPLKAGEPRGLPLDAVILPQRLQQLGYATHIIGKWHQGSCRSEYTPTRRGFDSFLGYWNGYNSYFTHRLNENGIEGYNLHRDFCPTGDYEGQYATDVFTQEAVDIIKRHDKSRPLYLHLAHLAVHTGNDDDPLEVPDVEAAHERFSYIESPERRMYAEMMRKLDDSVGSVVQALAIRGIINNTIIIFMADNGAQTVGQHANFGSNWPLRGLKFTLHEGGVRGVAAIWSPWFHQPGSVSNQLFHLTDWLPTLYSAAGGNVSALGDLDGVDQWPSLVNNEPPPRRHLLVNVDDVADMEALISDKWKIKRGDYKDGIYGGYYGENGTGAENPPYNITQILSSDVNVALENEALDGMKIEMLREAARVKCAPIVNDTVVVCAEYCLYDIVNDPCESVDLARDNNSTVTDLAAMLTTYRREAVTQLNQPVDPASNPVLHGDVWVPWLDAPGSNSKKCKSSASSLITTQITWIVTSAVIFQTMHRLFQSLQ